MNIYENIIITRIVGSMVIIIVSSIVCYAHLRTYFIINTFNKISHPDCQEEDNIPFGMRYQNTLFAKRIRVVKATLRKEGWLIYYSGRIFFLFYW